MKEIKFRAWLKKEKKMVKVEEINFTYKEVRFKDYKKPFTKPIEVTISFEDIELMQNTGLKDKNGVKIFEGDIVRCDDEICTIVWDEPYVTYAVSSKENGNDSLGNFEPKDLEVIGNIYENKKLLGWFDE